MFVLGTLHTIHKTQRTDGTVRNVYSLVPSVAVAVWASQGLVTSNPNRV